MSDKLDLFQRHQSPIYGSWDEPGTYDITDDYTFQAVICDIHGDECEDGKYLIYKKTFNSIQIDEVICDKCQEEI